MIYNINKSKQVLISCQFDSSDTNIYMFEVPFKSSAGFVSIIIFLHKKVHLIHTNK